ncbi:MAG: ABC transporter permease [Actinobacteria bacterium]|nr:ABC transporter permease [Actinomycetota bacterium]
MTGKEIRSRVGGTLLTLLGVSVVVFIVLRALPGDAITAKLGTESGVLDHAQRQALEHYYGIDQPLLAQYFGWLRAVLSGNLGVSADSGQSVTSMLAAALPVTVELAVLATLLGAPAGVFLGVLAAARPGRPRDIGVQGAALLGLAIPEFVLGSVLVAVLASAFGYFPNAGAFVPLTESVSANLGQMIYPAAVLAVAFAAIVMRTTRSAYLEMARADFVRTAQGKGLAPSRVRLRHVLHNAGIPILTIIGIQFGYLLGGTVIVEQIFALPGVGRLLLNAILNHDYAVVQSTVLVIAAIFVLVNLVVDLLYRVLDPRVRIS